MSQGSARRKLSVVIAGAAILAAAGCGGRSLGGENPPLTGIAGRGGVSGGQGGAGSGEGGAGGDAGGPAGVSGEGGLAGAAGGTAGAASGEGGAGSGGRVTGAGGTSVGTTNRKVDILFMIDNSPEMTEMQQKLYAQAPSFLSGLFALPVR